MGNYDHFSPGITKVATSSQDRLLAGNELPFLSKTIVILKGENVKRGSVLGLVDATGKAKLVSKDATDGSQIPKYVLAHKVDTTEDTKATAYKMGIFNRNYLYFADGTTSLNMELEMEDKQLHMVDGAKDYSGGQE